MDEGQEKYIFLWCQNYFRVYSDKNKYTRFTSDCLRFYLRLSSSCVVTLPSATCTKHCLSGHAWRRLCACLFFCVCACVEALPTSQDKRSVGGGGWHTHTHTTNTGRWMKEEQEITRKEGWWVGWWVGEGGAFYLSVAGRQPSAQIGPMGTRSLYTCSNQLATTTCLSGDFTLRHPPPTHTYTESRGRGLKTFSCSSGLKMMSWKSSRPVMVSIP